MSKERYELRYVGDWYCYVYDNEKQQGADICSLDDSVRIFNEQDKKIKDLETKLSGLQQEQITEMKEHQEAMQVADKTIKSLETQNKRVLEKLELIVRANQELEQKLAEKEKEIKNRLNYQKDLRKINNDLEFELNDIKQLVKDLKRKHYHDKISFCIEQLEKVKEFCDGIKLSMIYISQEDTTKIQTIIEEIDNQINVLRNNKDGIH